MALHTRIVYTIAHALLIGGIGLFFTTLWALTHTHNHAVIMYAVLCLFVAFGCVIGSSHLYSKMWAQVVIIKRK